MRGLVLLALLAGLPSLASAAPSDAALCVAGTVPCGFIAPIVDLQFPGRPHCPGPPSMAEPDQCIPLLADGESLTLRGNLSVSFNMNEEVYPIEEPIVVTFAARTSWLKPVVEPATFTIRQEDLADPQNLRPDTSGPTPVVWFDYRRPIEATFTRNGGPNATEQARIQSWGGIQTVYLAATTTASGAYYYASSGGEEFRFDAREFLQPETSSTTSAQAPAPSVLVALVVAALAAVARRRS